MSGEEQQLHIETLEKGNPTSEEEEEEIQALEREVKEMAQKILDFRRTLPDLLKKTLESSLAASRPILPQIDAAEAGISADRDLGAREHAESSKGVVLAEEDPEAAEKLRLLKLKLSKNLSAMPVILKRMRDCIEAIDKLDQYDVTAHPAFKRKRTH
ncbi:uncharacterized protein LOC131231262 [Magnolia sinica]|uniref:uncharacterized protein LOC131231262 n=1 Tax=Magnolia sinica TaxID=86752 RepID=UPI002658A87F|nr:uncharacterized protein LOC131231262 [Magnolia sinica]